jgi:DNA-binding MarR family transcriptional regulator
MQQPTLAIPSSSSSTGEVFRALLRTLGLLKRVMEPHFTTVGISGAQWAILRTLHDVETAGEPNVRLSELGNRLLVRPPSVTGIVRRLQRMGLIHVTTSPADQRAKTVALTDMGRGLVESFGAEHEARIDDVFSGLDPAQRDQLLGLLCQLGGHVEHLADRKTNDARRRRRTDHHAETSAAKTQQRNSRCGC